MGTATLKGYGTVEKKTVSISSKRQITIPAKFFNLLGFQTEAECVLRNNEIVIRPVKENAGGEFAEQILADLIKQGLEGQDLLAAFREQQSKVRPAVENMIAEAEAIAFGHGEYESYEDVFGTEE